MTMSSPSADAATVRSHPPVPTMPRNRIVFGVLAIALAGLNLRTAVASVSPIYSFLRQSRSDPHKAAYNAWTWPTSSAITIVFAAGALDMYALIAWLPSMLTETAGIQRGPPA